jgi:hypothetical protein
MKRIGLYLAIILMSLASTGWLAADERFIIGLAQTMIRYNQDYPMERVYIHLDKQLYKPGEQIWFKAYISSTLSEKYSSLSNDLYIKVFDVFGNELAWKRYPVMNNTATGVIDIPNSVEEGKYILTAFTGWMKNMDVTDVYPFELVISKNAGRQLLINVEFPGKSVSPFKEIKAALYVCTADSQRAAGAAYIYSVNVAGEKIEKGKGRTDDQGKALISFSLPGYEEDKLATLNIEVKYSGERESFLKHIPLVSDNIDLKFYPEGGNIVAGLENRIAFRVTDAHGYPLAIKGTLCDAADNPVKQIESNRTGMGVFKLNPSPQQYKIKIDSSFDVGSEFPLPEIDENGLVLTYKGTDHGNIILSAAFSDAEEIVETYWVGRMNNKIYWGTIIRLKGPRTVEIPLINFPPGIVQIDVFNEDKMKIAGRFIYAGEAYRNKIEAATDKKIYGTREKVTVRLMTDGTYNDSLKTDISLSVVNKNLSVNSCKSQSFLNPHLINCRLSDETISFISRVGCGELKDNVDLLMMSLATKDPSYSDILSTDIFRRHPYYNHDGLSGAVIDKNGNLLRKAAIKVVHNPDMQTYETTSDENGLFNILFGDRTINLNLLTLTVSDDLISKVTGIIVDNNFPDRTVKHFTVTDDTWEAQKTIDLIAYGNPDILYTGKYRKPKKNKIFIEQKKKGNMINYSSYVSVLDIINQIKPFTIINGQIVFQGGINSVYSQQGALIVLDGMQMGTDVNILESISTSDIENINISTSIVDIHSYTGLNSQGVIEITTKKGEFNPPSGNRADSESNEPDDYRDFSSPDYGRETDINEDLRKTLYWKSNITVSQREITEISFYTSDVRGVYTGRIEGLRSDGIPVSGQFQFKVE